VVVSCGLDDNSLLDFGVEVGDEDMLARIALSSILDDL
jgi:hypothetical protein